MAAVATRARPTSGWAQRRRLLARRARRGGAECLDERVDSPSVDAPGLLGNFQMLAYLYDVLALVRQSLAHAQLANDLPGARYALYRHRLSSLRRGSPGRGLRQPPDHYIGTKLGGPA